MNQNLEGRNIYSQKLSVLKKDKEKELNKLTVWILNYERDWFFAGDVANEILKIVNNGIESSYIISSGKSHSIECLISLVFDFYNLNWEKYIEVDPSLLRKGDPEKIYSDPKKLVNELGWSPKHNFEQLVERCVLKYESF